MDAGRQRTLLILATLAGVLVIVAWSCLPILGHPQLRPDDYRYLDLVARWRHGDLGLLDASVVENRWDQLWWIDVDGVVRFFRPLVVLSYWFDTMVHGSDAGFLATNIVIHLLCSLAVYALLCRWFGVGLPSLVATWLFAAMFCHGEVLWYVAGRTDSLAALFALISLGCYSWAGSGASGRLLRVACVAAFALGLLSKETVLGLPIICLLADRYLLDRSAGMRESLARERWVYWSFAGLAVVIIGVGRWTVSSAGGAGFPEPYFIMPTAGGFPGHLWTLARNYSENLLLATPTPAFLGSHALAHFSSWWGLCLTAAAIAAVIAMNRKDRGFWTLVLLALVTWAPTSIAYVSERYLYLPSVAVVAVVAMSLGKLRGISARVGLAVALIWCGHQAYQLRAKNAALMTGSKEAKVIADQLGDLEIAADQLLLVNLPATWVGAQFSEDLLRVVLADPTLDVKVLTVMPMRSEMGGQSDLHRRGQTLVLTGRPDGDEPRRRQIVIEPTGGPFPWVDLSSGSQYQVAAEGMTVVTTQGIRWAAAEVEFRFTRPIDDAVILRWLPSSDQSLSPSERVRRATVQLIPVSAL